MIKPAARGFSFTNLIEGHGGAGIVNGDRMQVIMHCLSAKLPTQIQQVTRGLSCLKLGPEAALPELNYVVVEKCTAAALANTPLRA